MPLTKGRLLDLLASSPALYHYTTDAPLNKAMWAYNGYTCVNYIYIHVIVQEIEWHPYYLIYSEKVLHTEIDSISPASAETIQQI